MWGDEVKSDIKSVLAGGGKEAESLRDLINVDKYKNFNSVKNAYETLSNLGILNKINGEYIFNQ